MKSDDDLRAGDLESCLTLRELARRWRCRVERVRRLIREGVLAAIEFNGRLRITPEAVRKAEAGVLAAQPSSRRRRREAIPREVVELLGQDDG